MSVIWTQKHLPTDPSQTLPIALAMLATTKSATEIDLTIMQLKANLPFISSLWVGESPDTIDDFAAARNLVLPLISEPWVFWLDSDETLAEPAAAYQYLKSIIDQLEAPGFYLEREDWFHQQPVFFGEAGASQILRIHRPQAGQFINQVHEVFSPYLPEKIRTSPLKIYHHSHNSVSEFFAKISRYALIRAKERAADKQPPQKMQLIWELIWWPLGKFWLNFIWRQGFKDGYRGLIYAVMMSLHSGLVRIFGLEIWLKKTSSLSHEN